MIRRENGFTMVELMITMVIFVIAMVAASNIFSGILNQFKQQTKIAETNIEGVIGLQMFRTDLEQAGFGLPFDLDGTAYNEAVSTNQPYVTPGDFNDSPNPPRAIVAGHGVGMNDSDVLVIKASNIGINAPSQKWAYRTSTGGLIVNKEWTDIDGNAVTAENFNAEDRVIVLKPVVQDRQQVLVRSVDFYSRFDGLDDFEPPTTLNETHLIYGIGTDSALRMPFNRADFYIRRSADMPQRCAQGTGILYKGVLRHNDGQFNEMELLDCVLAMKVVFGLDTDADGITDTFSSPEGIDAIGVGADGIEDTLNIAELLRTRLKQIRVYIVAHEGQRDNTYTYPDASISIEDPDVGVLKNLNLAAVTGDDVNWDKYRWKIYTIVATPHNLR
jgi:prepilin-type N-terminal cleavage/methylation domain-containing protein